MDKKKKKKKKQSFKNFFKKLKIETKKNEKKSNSISENQEEINRIFDVGKKIVSILNKIQIIDFIFERLINLNLIKNKNFNENIKKEIKSFCQELEQQFYNVMEKIIQFYSQKISEKVVDKKNSTFDSPSMETFGLLNILGEFIII